MQYVSKFLRPVMGVPSRVARTFVRVRSTLLELTGFALLSVAAWQVDPILGLGAAGLSCILVGHAFSKPPHGRRS